MPGMSQFRSVSETTGPGFAGASLSEIYDRDICVRIRIRNLCGGSGRRRGQRVSSPGGDRDGRMGNSPQKCKRRSRGTGTKTIAGSRGTLGRSESGSGFGERIRGLASCVELSAGGSIGNRRGAARRSNARERIARSRAPGARSPVVSLVGTIRPPWRSGSLGGGPIEPRDGVSGSLATLEPRPGDRRWTHSSNLPCSLDRPCDPSTG